MLAHHVRVFDLRAGQRRVPRDGAAKLKRTSRLAIIAGEVAARAALVVQPLGAVWPSAGYRSRHAWRCRRACTPGRDASNAAASTSSASASELPLDRPRSAEVDEAGEVREQPVPPGAEHEHRAGAEGLVRGRRVAVLGAALVADEGQPRWMPLPQSASAPAPASCQPVHSGTGRPRAPRLSLRRRLTERAVAFELFGQSEPRSAGKPGGRVTPRRGGEVAGDCPGPAVATCCSRGSDPPTARPRLRGPRAALLQQARAFDSCR